MVHRKTRKLNAGKLVNSGTFGCLFNPALLCKNSKSEFCCLQGYEGN